jgi:hypothetical protein
MSSIVYQVIITVTLQKTVKAIADTPDEAITGTMQQYLDGEIVLDNSDFIGYAIDIGCAIEVKRQQ